VTTKKIIFIICFFFTSINNIYGASFKISPSQGSFNQNCSSKVDILIDSQNASTNAADIIVEYDPSKIDVTRVVTGDVYPNYFGNIIDSSSGTIRLTGASFVGSLNGHGTFATIEFKPKVNNGTGTFNVRFTGADQYNTLDSNIADTNTSNDILTSVENGYFSFASGSCVNDTSPPNINFIAPINHQQNVPALSNLQISISDQNSGVNINTVQLIINGETYSSINSQVITSGNSSQYNFILTPNAPLFITQSNTFMVKATDLAGNSKISTINFNNPITVITNQAICPEITPFLPNTTLLTPTPTSIPTPISTITTDQNSPTIEFISPKSKQETDTNPTIQIHLSDIDTGIDQNTLNITLNNQIYTINSSNLQFSGDTVNVYLNQKLEPNKNYLLTAYIADKAGNGISQSINFKTKNTIFNQISQISKKTTATPSLIFLIPLILMFIILYYLFHQHQTNPNVKPYGIIFDSQTNEPLSGIKVTVFDEFGKIIKTSVTNIFGIFALNLSSNKYRFVIYNPKYSFPAINLRHPFDYPYPYQGKIINIDQNDPPYLEIPLDPKSSLKKSDYGLVTDNQKQPLANICLELWQTKINKPVYTRYTDSNGQYRFQVPHGRYILKTSSKSNVDILFDTRHLITPFTTIIPDIVI